MRACIQESGMLLPETDVQDLAAALYEDALGKMIDSGGINVDQLRNTFAKHPGLIDNMSVRYSTPVIQLLHFIQDAFHALMCPPPYIMLTVAAILVLFVYKELNLIFTCSNIVARIKMKNN